MNVLILTPNRVGSTFLQRVLTIYMLRREFDKPVINLHDLTKGLEKYWNTTLEQEVLGRPKDTDWGYYQTLPEIQDMLSSVDHYVTSRLAHYQMVNRQDTIAEQLKFYDYLNENFYIISCRRKNVLEHALSWGIKAHSKRLNIYSGQELINRFYDIYKNKITVNKESLIVYLNKYKSYIEWSDRHFNVQSYFHYENDAPKIEDYILNLDFMRGAKNNSWQDMFGIEFNQWNSCHRMLPNLLLTGQQGGQSFDLLNVVREIEWNEIKGADWPEFKSAAEFKSIDEMTHLPANIREEIRGQFDLFDFKQTFNLDHATINFLNKNLSAYTSTAGQIRTLVKQGFLVTEVPIKLQSLSEKKMVINNFTDSIEWYNEWAVANGYDIYNEVDLNKLANQEDAMLNRFITESTNLPAVK
jgi:hypothetical protein